MNGKRLSKWMRSKTPDRLILQRRDREIMVAVYTFRFLTREQMQRLLGWDCERRINIRLRKLYDHSYLARKFLPTIRGSAKAIYYLGQKGIGAVAEELGLDQDLVRKKAKQAGELKEVFFSHNIGINEVRMNLSEAISLHPEMSLESWIAEDDCQQEYAINLSGREIVRRLRPDGYFRVWHNDKLHSFFLEYDRSTMSRSKFRSKAETYLEFARLGFYERVFGVKYFRVLVVTLTQKRLFNLKRTIETIAGIATRSFWFATVQDTAPDRIFGPVWQRAGSSGLHSLISEPTRV